MCFVKVTKLLKLQPNESRTLKCSHDSCYMVKYERC